MLYLTYIDFKVVNKFVLFLLVLIYASCNKNQVEAEPEEKYTISTVWEINSDKTIRHQDGAIYKDEYLIFSFGENKRTIKSYDIKNKNELWEYDLTAYPGWGGQIYIHDQYLVMHNEDTGIAVFDLDKKKLINTLRPEGNSYSPPTYYNNKIYIAVQDHYHTKFIIKSINAIDGKIEELYEWSQNKGLYNRLTSPLVFKDDKADLNFIMLLQLYNREEGDDFYSETFLFSVNKGWALNWIDTLGYAGKANFIKYLPGKIKDNIIVHHTKSFTSYNIYTGEKNWVKNISDNNFAKLIVKNNDLYSIHGAYRNYSKLDTNTGEKDWGIETFIDLTFENFELLDNHIVLVINNLTVIDNSSGNFVKTENQFEKGIANPKFYAKDSLFITHQANRVIGFKLQPVN